MKYHALTRQDRELISHATAIISQNYVKGRHHVGAAVGCKSGHTYSGVNLEFRIIDICAEPTATGVAASQGERNFETIVAVTMAEGKQPRTLSPCGSCRELVNFYNPNCMVIIMERGTVKKCKAKDLLPVPYIDSEARPEIST